MLSNMLYKHLLQLRFSFQLFFFFCSQWLILRLLCLSLLLFGSWASGRVCCSFVSFISAAKGSLMAILKLLMPFLLFSSYSLPLQQCTLSQFPLLDLCSIKFLCQTDIYFVVAASDVLSSMLVKSSFVAVPKKHWNM